MSYRIFTRTWWRRNKDWPDGLEPWPGRKVYIGVAATESEARAQCAEWNGTHRPGKLSNKAEYESV